MKPTIVHVTDQLNEGGTALGILNLVKHGFYSDVDLHVIGLVQGDGSVHQKFIDLIGADRVTCLYPEVSDVLSASIVARSTFQLAKEFRRIQPQTAVLSLEVTNVVGRTAALGHPDLKVISFEHSTWHGRKLGAALHFTALRVDAMFADTPETTRVISEKYGRCANGITKHYVPLTICEVSEPRLARNPTVFQILSMGQLEKVKNYSMLLEAVAELVEAGRDVELTLAGAGRQRDMLLQRAHELSISGRVHMPGFVADEAEKQRLRDQADIYIQPSDFEGFSITVAEALAAGIPTIATNTGGMRDYGRHNENMIKITEPPTREKIVAALSHLMDQYVELAPRLTAEAIKTAEQTFSEAAVLAQRETTKAELVTPVTPAMRLARLLPNNKQ